jgi:hypothetical protein
MSDGYKGTHIVINTEAIVTIYTNMVKGEDGTIVPETFVFCPPHGTWEVAETIEQIMDKING